MSVKRAAEVSLDEKAEKKQKVEVPKSPVPIEDLSELGLGKDVFFVDEKVTLKYPETILNHIPFFLDTYRNAKENKFTIRPEFVGILPLFYRTFVSKKCDKLSTASVEEINTLIDFIHHYCVVRDMESEFFAEESALTKVITHRVLMQEKDFARKFDTLMQSNPEKEKINDNFFFSLIAKKTEEVREEEEHKTYLNFFAFESLVKFPPRFMCAMASSLASFSRTVIEEKKNLIIQITSHSVTHRCYQR